MREQREGTKRRRERGERREEEREKERNEKHKDKTSDGLEPIFKYQTLHWCVFDVGVCLPIWCKGCEGRGGWALQCNGGGTTRLLFDRALFKQRQR